MEQEKKEKRKYYRVGLSTRVTYNVIGESEEQKHMSAKDISGGGIRIPLNENLKVGTLLNIKIEFLNKHESVSAKGKIVWIRLAFDNLEFFYEAGIEFLDLNVEQRIKISNCAIYLERNELLKSIGIDPSTLKNLE